MMGGHLPVLLIMIPLAAAPLCVLFNRPVLAWGIAAFAAFFAFAGSLILYAQVKSFGVISYHLGGWAPPLGIELRLDAANSFVIVFISAIGFLCTLFALKTVAREISREDQPLFYAMLILCFAGLLGVVSTGDAFNLFVFLEICSLSAYVLVAMGARQDKRALTAAFTYLLFGTIGATFYVIGLGLIYALTGTLNMMDMAARIAGLGHSGTLQVGFGFIIIGLGLKLAIFPLHQWLPNAYSYAPSIVSAFLAGTATKAAAYAALRFMYTIFGPVFHFETVTLHYLFLPLGLAAIFIASIVAIFQSNIKRLLAYSSIAQMGYILVGVSFANLNGLMAALLHLFNHAIMKSGLFLAVACVVYRMGDSSIASFRGLGRVMPWTMAAFVIGGLSLIGIPATVGFTSKWYLVLAGLERGWWPAAVAIVAGSLLALFYFGRVVEVAYFQPAPDGGTVREAPIGMLLPLWALTIASVAFGIDSEITVTGARAAADALFLNINAVSSVQAVP